MESKILTAFSIILLVGVAVNVPILYALAAGYIMFCVYSLLKGFTLSDVAKMSLDGIKTTKNILITFLLIGVITALWRAGGTIPYIVSMCAGFMNPGFFAVVAFLLNCLVSFLTGTAFGTSATMGSICMTVSHALGANPVLTGGAVLAGAYFGDRCSPVSTSALLTAGITGTNIYKNIGCMMKSGAIPFIISVVLYIIFGRLTPVESIPLPDIKGIFAVEFDFSPLMLMPAIVMLILSLLRVRVKVTMLCSIIASVLVCLVCQRMNVGEILSASLLGYVAHDEEISAMINGGGVISMLRVTAIVCISSCYSGIFRKTGMLEPVKKRILSLSERFGEYPTILITSIIAGMIACNQTLTIMLTSQLCGDAVRDKQRLALMLEDSAVVVPPLIPWSIASSVSLVSAGAPPLSVVAAFFLFLLPLTGIVFWRTRIR